MSQLADQARFVAALTIGSQSYQSLLANAERGLTAAASALAGRKPDQRYLALGAGRLGQ